MSASTHRGRCKMAAISQMTFWKSFFVKKMYEFRIRFHRSCSNIGLDDSLAPTRRQAIIGTNGGLSHLTIYASLGLNGLLAILIYLMLSTVIYMLIILMTEISIPLIKRIATEKNENSKCLKFNLYYLIHKYMTYFISTTMKWISNECPYLSL